MESLTFSETLWWKCSFNVWMMYMYNRKSTASDKTILKFLQLPLRTCEEIWQLNKPQAAPRPPPPAFGLICLKNDFAAEPDVVKERSVSHMGCLCTVHWATQILYCLGAIHIPLKVAVNVPQRELFTSHTMELFTSHTQQLCTSQT